MTNDEFPVPAEISGYPILDYTYVPARRGELPVQAVTMGRDPLRREERGYAVWHAAVRGGEWTMGDGTYDMSLDEARDEYARRVASEIRSRPLRSDAF